MPEKPEVQKFKKEVKNERIQGCNALKEQNIWIVNCFQQMKRYRKKEGAKRYMKYFNKEAD